MRGAEPIGVMALYEVALQRSTVRFIRNAFKSSQCVFSMRALQLAIRMIDINRNMMSSL